MVNAVPAAAQPATNLVYDPATDSLMYFNKATGAWAALPETALRRKFVTENFTAADSSTGLVGKVTTTGGKTWACDDVSATWGIASNQGYVSASPGNTTVYVDSGQTQVRVQATIAAVPAGGLGGLVLRRQDKDNYFHAAIRGTGSILKYSISKRVAGTLSILADSNPSITPTAGDIVQFADDGTTLSLIVNGQTIATSTDTAFATATKQGFYGNFSGGGSGGRYDNFSVQAF